MMVGPLDDKFIKRSNENSALFHHFPGAIYEFRDRVWRVKEMRGNTPKEIAMRTNAFQELLDELERRDIHVQYFSGLTQGLSEVFPMTWYCSNNSCNRFVAGHPGDRICTKCKVGEMRQIPIVAICDNCGHMDAIRVNLCSRRHDRSNWRLVMYEREKIGSWRVICQACLEDSAKRNHFLPRDPGSFRDYDEDFRVASDLNPGSPCPSCQASRATRTTAGKRIVPAGANVVSPAFITTFDKDVPNIMSSAKARASQEMEHDEDLRAAFEAMQRDYAIKDVHLADITALSCTYGYRVGRFTKEIPFQDGTIYLKSDHCEALVFEFDEKRIPEANRERILHAISHALLQIAGYISGLDNEVYKEFIHAPSCSVMIFTTEAGGCELFVKEPAKLDRWLKRSRAVVHECKNQCPEGCPWCIHLRTWQCYRNNHDLDRASLAQLWNRRAI